MQTLTNKLRLAPSEIARRRIRLILFSWLILGACVTTANAQASGTLRVSVRYQNQNPVNLANLCFASSTQAISRMTDTTGTYNASLPAGLNKVRVWKSGYRTISEEVTITANTVATREYILEPGVGDPIPTECGILATTTPGNNCVNITEVRADGGQNTTSRILTLRATFDGPAKAYRIKQFTEEENYRYGHLSGAEKMQALNVLWQPISPSATSLSLPFTRNATTEYGYPYGHHTVFLQVASHVVDNPTTATPVDYVGCLSKTRLVTVTLAPASLKTYTLTGAALDNFVREAENRGYQFHNNFENNGLGQNSFDCYPGQFKRPSQNTARSSNSITAIFTLSYEVFDGPGLNLHWKVKSMDAVSSFFPRFISASGGLLPSQPAIVITEDVTGTGQGPGLLRRTFHWTLTLYRFIENPLDPPPCVPARAGAGLRELVLEGPDGLSPLDALQRVR